MNGFPDLILIFILLSLRALLDVIVVIILLSVQHCIIHLDTFPAIISEHHLVVLLIKAVPLAGQGGQSGKLSLT
jgi:hypothetical protein